MKTALIFAGQGSQTVGMAKDIVDASSDAALLVQHASDILGFDIGSMMFDGPEELLRETRYTQPALFIHEALIVNHIQSSGYDAVAGHSLGEYTALYASKVLSFDDAVKLVGLRGKLMFEAGTAIPGTMAAVVGLDDNVVDEICKELSTDKAVVVAANFNSPGQVVISGSADAVRASLPVFKERGARMVKELQVSGAFHSPLLQSIQDEFAAAVRSTTFNDANADVYCNVTAEPERNGAALQNNAISQLTSPVRWTQTLVNMEKNGVQRMIEIGPGKVLQGLVKRTLPNVEILGLDTLASMEAFAGV